MYLYSYGAMIALTGLTFGFGYHWNQEPASDFCSGNMPILNLETAMFPILMFLALMGKTESHIVSLRVSPALGVTLSLICYILTAASYNFTSPLKNYSFKAFIFQLQVLRFGFWFIF